MEREIGKGVHSARANIVVLRCLLLFGLTKVSGVLCQVNHVSAKGSLAHGPQRRSQGMVFHVREILVVHDPSEGWSNRGAGR